jgi:hypothetical protein
MCVFASIISNSGYKYNTTYDAPIIIAYMSYDELSPHLEGLLRKQGVWVCFASKGYASV